MKSEDTGTMLHLILSPCICLFLWLIQSFSCFSVAKKRTVPGHIGGRAAATNHQNTTFCCCATQKCYSGQCIYCLIYCSQWGVGPIGVSRLNPGVVAMWPAHFKLNLNVLFVLNDTSLSPSLSVSVGHVLFLQDSTWKAKDDPVSICLCSGSIIAAFPLESSTYE